MVKGFTGALVLIAIVTGSPLQAAPAKKAPPRKTVKPGADDPSAALAAALIANSTQHTTDLSHACINTNFKALAFALDHTARALSPQKGEFETETSYETRTGKLDAALNGDRYIVICLPLSDKYDSPFTYDADKEEFTGSFAKDLRVDLDYRNLPSYIGKTRMNISFKITRSVEVDYKAKLVFDDKIRSSCFQSNYSDITYKIPVRGADAQLLKLRGHLIILGHLIQPYITKTDSQSTPSLDEPNDDATRVYDVSIKPTQFVILSGRGDAVLTCPLS